MPILASTALAFSLLQPAPAVQPAPEMAVPSDAGEKADTVSVAAKDVPQKVVCRSQAIVGSKFKKRICGTEADWEALRAKASADAAEMQRRGKGLSPNGR